MLKLIVCVVMLFANISFAGDLPNNKITPGSINRSVNQNNIQSTICVSGWTKTIRPHASYTNKLKLKQLSSGVYASLLPPNSFEEDHLISLEIGGNPTSKLNLWPQHRSAPFGAYQKGRLENKLHKLVCSGKISLSVAQEVVAKDWIAAYHIYVQGK